MQIIVSGRMAEFDFGKSVPYEITIEPKMCYKVATDGLESISTESVEFNNKYNVYAADGHTAFYVLTPHFIESILELGKSCNVYMKFINGKVYIIRDGLKDSFNPPIFKTIDFITETKKTKEEMDKLLGVIDTLKLDAFTEVD